MAKNRKKYRRGRRRKGNWFTRLKLWKRILLCFGFLFLGLLAVAGLYIAVQWGKVDRTDIRTEDIVINQDMKKNPEVDLGEGYTNIALFGVDSRDGDMGEGNRTDCIIIASLNNETKEIKMVSVYRDTLLDLSEGTYQKCNSAYSYGGPKLAINMLNMNFDLDIKDYVTVDFGAISDIVDCVGGIEIDVTDEEAFYISEYLQETADAAGKAPHFLEEGGHLLLDGPQATTYARIRSTEGGDFTRTERQRLVIEKVVEKLKRVNMKTLDQIIDRVFPKVSTSFTLKEIMNYALVYKEYKLIDNVGFPFEHEFDSIPGVGSVVVPISLVSNVEKLHEFLFGTVGYVPSSTVNMVSSNIEYRGGGIGASGNADTYVAEENEYYDEDTLEMESSEQNVVAPENQEETMTDQTNSDDLGQGNIDSSGEGQ